MPPVARSDCQQADVKLTATLTRDDTSGLLATQFGNDLNVEFNSCRGINFSTGTGKNNDLSAHVNKLFLDGKYSEAMRDNVFDVLVGYQNPNQNNNEDACEAKYEAVTDKVYPCVGIDDFAVNGCDYRSLLDALQKKINRISDCPHNAEVELQYHTGTTSAAAAKEYVSGICDNAWSEVAESSFTDVDNKFDDAFMVEYANGGTFLNRK
jgi:hypothetical protein